MRRRHRRRRRADRAAARRGGIPARPAHRRLDLRAGRNPCASLDSSSPKSGPSWRGPCTVSLSAPEVLSGAVGSLFSGDVAGGASSASGTKSSSISGGNSSATGMPSVSERCDRMQLTDHFDCAAPFEPHFPRHPSPERPENGSRTAHPTYGGCRQIDGRRASNGRHVVR